MSGVKLTPDEAAVLTDGRAANLLDLEVRLGGQRAALQAHPELRDVALLVQRIRAKTAAAELGLPELDLSRGRPLPPDVIADAERVFRAIVAAHDD